MKILILLFFVSFSAFGREEEVHCDISNYKEFLYSRDYVCDVEGEELAGFDFSGAKSRDLVYDENTNFSFAKYDMFTKLPFNPKNKEMIEKDVILDIDLNVKIPIQPGHSWSKLKVKITYYEYKDSLIRKNVVYDGPSGSTFVDTITIPRVAVNKEIHVEAIYHGKMYDMIFKDILIEQCDFSNIEDKGYCGTIDLNISENHRSSMCNSLNYREFIYNKEKMEYLFRTGRGCDLKRADLRGVDLSTADLRGANMNEALYDDNTNFEGILYDRKTDFPGVDFIFRIGNL